MAPITETREREMPLPRVFVIGDSISIHYGPHLERMLAGRFAYARKSDAGEALLDLDRPQGANGGDSSMVLEYVQALATAGALRVEYLLLNCGLHDLRTDPRTGAKQVPLHAYRANLRRIVPLAKLLADRLLWVRTTPVHDAQHNDREIAFHRHATDVDAYNACADEVMLADGVASIDLFGFTRALGGRELFVDHVHFAEPVRALQAAFIAGHLFALEASAAARTTS